MDKVYSPSMSEGMAIETRPSAGALARVGDGVRLKVATLQKPVGYAEPADGPKPETRPGGQGGVVVVKVPGHGDVFVGEGAGEQAPITEANPNLTVFDQEAGRPEGGKRVIPNPALPLRPEARPNSEPAQPLVPKQTTVPLTPKGKVAKVHYQVPPLAQPLDLRIEKMEPSGKTVVLDRKARSGERVSLEVPYEKECVVTFYLGGEFVWQDKYQ